MDNTKNRDFMKAVYNKIGETDQKNGVEKPLLQKPFDADAKLIKLPDFGVEILRKNDIMMCIQGRKSHRKYIKEELSMAELSYLLHSTQGVRHILKNGVAAFRTVPSGGARHPFETYLYIHRVESLEPGFYRFLAFENALIKLSESNIASEKVIDACMGQGFAGEAAVTFFWSCIPYRAEWRYDIAAHKAILLDAGHICQNLYLACESIGCGTCAIAAYDQEKVDALFNLDGQDEFVVYISPVGRVEEK